MSSLRPRLCALEKGSDGYGFHLHGEKGKSGQYIRLVEPDSPAAAAGLLAGDKLAFVNGESVEGESHQQVVTRIRATVGALELVVLDDETEQLLEKHNLRCRREFVTDGVPMGGDGDSDRGDSPSNGTRTPVAPHRLSVSSKEGNVQLRPRLCQMKKGSNGYGFNLHSEKTKPGQYIRAVDDDSPAQRAGLLPQDKIIQVNSMVVLGMQHSEVVAAIKAGGDETSLLVVDPEADEFFKSCNVTPTEDHLTGPLPEPMSNRLAEEEVSEKAVADAHPAVSLSPSSSSSSSNTSLPTASSSALEAEKAGPEAGGGLSLGMSLAQAREKARQKRSAKKAPQMDWSKRNELFSNL